MTAVAPAIPVLAVSGLIAEARIASGVGVQTLAGGGDAARLAVLLQGSLAAGAHAVISFGIAGGLAPGLPAGTVVVADTVDDGETCWDTDPQWRARLLASLPVAVRGRLAGTDRAVADRAEKVALHRRSGAVAVDMESHIAARLAAQHKVPFVALRVIADPAERSLPAAALVGMRPDGTTDIGAVLRALARRPGDLPGLIRTALDARAAFSNLASSRKQLDALFGLGTLPTFEGARHPLVDVPQPADIRLDPALALAERARTAADRDYPDPSMNSNGPARLTVCSRCPGQSAQGRRMRSTR